MLEEHNWRDKFIWKTTINSFAKQTLSLYTCVQSRGLNSNANCMTLFLSTFGLRLKFHENLATFDWYRPSAADDFFRP